MPCSVLRTGKSSVPNVQTGSLAYQKHGSCIAVDYFFASTDTLQTSLICMSAAAKHAEVALPAQVLESTVKAHERLTALLTRQTVWCLYVHVEFCIAGRTSLDMPVWNCTVVDQSEQCKHHSLPALYSLFSPLLGCNAHGVFVDILTWLQPPPWSTRQNSA